MSKAKVHVLIPNTIDAACKTPHVAANALYRDKVTCKLCKRTEWYKRLPALPRRFRK